MAKKKTKNTENAPENTENTPVVNNENNAEETPVTEEVAPEVAEETQVTEEVAPEVVAPVAKEKSAQATFEELIAKTPYAIYQNGIMICHSNPYLVIKTEAKYFEINFKKFSYQGIEVKHK